MGKKRQSSSTSSRVREVVDQPPDEPLAAVQPIRTKVPMPCEDCRAQNAFHAWSDIPLTAHAINCSLVFTDKVQIPEGKRAVIELVTATIAVPTGEIALLRLFTSLGHAPSNLDLVLTPQGEFLGLQRLVATHSLRVYSDHLIEFSVSRNDSETAGEALVGISGYLVDV